MRYFATLVLGQDYRVSGITFRHGQEREVHKDLYDYLNGNRQFKVRVENNSTAPTHTTAQDEKTAENPPSATSKPLSAMSRTELLEEAKRLGLRGVSNLNKADLVQAIEDARAMMEE